MGSKPHAVAIIMIMITMFLLACMTTLCCADPEQTAGKVEGNGVVMFAYEADSLIPNEELVAELKTVRTAGADVVAVNFMLTQDGPDGSNVTMGEATPTPETLAAFAGAAKAVGLRVLLKPLIVCGHGCIMINVTAADPDAWFASYTRALDPYLNAAEASDGAIVGFSIGLELVRVTCAPANEDRWLELVAHARAVFSGYLTYSSIFVPPLYVETSCMPPRLWTALDAIGLDWYGTFPDPTPSAMASAATRYLELALQVQADIGPDAPPLLLTELGYPSRVDGGLNPSSEPASRTSCFTTPGDHPDNAFQAAAFNATLSAVLPQSSVAGTLIFAIDTPGSPAFYPDRDSNVWACTWSPRHKPAFCTIASFFGGDLSPSECRVSL